MAIVKNENKTYTVEPLYQWDRNQVLEIRGLSLATIPEVHFPNDAMGCALVRQARMDAAGVITVDVPDSLLQKPYKITVFVCRYASGTFETLYKLELPVKPRAMPGDYTLTDGEEYYSFNEIENQVANMQVQADKTEEIAKAAANTANGIAGTAQAANNTAAAANKTAEDAKQTAADAVAAVNSKAVVTRGDATLSAAGWVRDAAPYVQTVAVEGILETDRPHISPV